MKLLFWKREKEHMSPFEFTHSVVKVASVVIIWRGIWYLLDMVDYKFFDNNHTVTAVLGIAVGLALLYLPDRDLKELEKH